MDTGRFLVQPGAAVDLAGFDTRDTETFTGEAPWYIVRPIASGSATW